MDETWVRERGTDCYSPIEFGEGGRYSIVTGMMFYGSPPGKVVGEFWYDDQGELHVELGETDGRKDEDYLD